MASECKQQQELKDKVALLEKQAEAAASIAQNGPQNYQQQQVGQQQATIFSGVGSAGSMMNVPTPQGQLLPPAPPTLPTITMAGSNDNSIESHQHLAERMALKGSRKCRKIGCMRKSE